MKKLTFLLAAALVLSPLVPSNFSQSKGGKIKINPDRSQPPQSVPKPEVRLIPGAGSAALNTAALFEPGTIFVVDVGNNLRHFNPATPGKIDGTVSIQGLQPGENILGIDFRPATGQLYAVGSTSQVYRINAVTGLASPVDGQFTPSLFGTDFGFDFNPTVDRIRLVSDAEQNIRLNPDTGLVAGVDNSINPAGNLVASAYSNNFSGATSTTLYGLDSASDQLVIQNPPNDGTVTPVGALGVDTNGLVGFDIAPGTGTAYASLTAPAASTSSLYTVNLSTGAATLVGTIGGGINIRGLAVVAGPETVFAVTSGNNLLRFESNAPGSIVSSTAITGLQSGENILGIDFRPATGQLYGLGSTSRLYLIDWTNGSATQVGPGPFTPLLNGTDFGFDFNPQADRIRVVSDAEQNLRLNPINGAVAGIDTNLNPPGNVVAAAYTNNFAGTSGTTLYDIDSNSDLLLIQNPPNLGTLSAVGPLNVNTTGLTGFDIAPNGIAFASMTLPAATTSNLYTVNIASGSATLIGTIGGNETIRDIAVRLNAEVVYGVTQTSGGTFNLITFNAAVPGVILSTVAITGLQPAESIRGIDFRPLTGRLYALGSTNRLYIIDQTTGAATAVNGPFSPALNGTSFGMDFNPTVDRIRVVSDNEQNLRLNPHTGLVQNTDLALNPAGNVVAAAYTNNFAGAVSTTLYDIDSVSDTLDIQAPPNDGTLTIVGSLGVDVSSTIGFDIAPASGTAFMTGYLPAAVLPSLFNVNLATGAATLIGNVNTTDTLIGISVQNSISNVAGTDTAGIYDPATGAWFLRNTNSPGSADLVFLFGPGGAGLVPLAGDWDGDGDDTPGLYNPTNGAFFLRNSNSPGPAEVPAFFFGPGGSNFIPIVGDWDGDGRDTVGIYDASTGAFFLKNTNASGAADRVFVFGAGGATPLVGDWNGDGVDTIGIYVAASAAFFLRNSNSSGPADIAPFTFGPPNLRPLTGDWNGDGVDTVGIYNPAGGSWFLSNGFTGGAADIVFTYGPPGATPITGDWDNR
jgi:trimeric autotransporter adhesin